MRIFVFDTETDGLMRGSYDSLEACHMASIALLVLDTDKMRVEASFNTMLQPDGWSIDGTVAGQINGLDDETLNTFGMPAQTALAPVVELLLPCELIVGFNVAFDIKVLAAALYRANMLDELDSLLRKDSFCAMQESKHIVKAVNKKGSLKNPKLTEAYEFFFDKPLNNAHSASADTVGCLEIYMAIQNHNAEATDNTDAPVDAVDPMADISL